MPPTPGNLCVTRQYVEVLGPGDGKVRVTRQYVEVLAPYAAVAVDDELTLTDEFTFNMVRVVNLTDDLGLVEDMVVCGPQYVEMRSSFQLEEQLDVQLLRVIQVDLEDTLALTQHLGKTWEVDIHDTLTLSQGVTTRRWEDGIPDEVLTFSEELTVSLVRNRAHVLTFEETLVYNLDAVRVVTQDLSLRQSLVYELDARRSTQRYTPFIGSSDDPAFTPPSATCPMPAAGIGECRLVYPATARPITDSLVLRNPEFDNKDRLQFNRINRETRGGTLVVFADSDWPKMQTLVLTFHGLTQTQADAYLVFLSDHLGQEVGLVDWEGRYWKGIIVNPTDPVVNDSREVYTVTFEFEAESATWEP